MPDPSKGSDRRGADNTGADDIPTESVLSPAMQKAYDEARAKVMDTDGHPTPHYQAYLKYKDQYQSKVKARQKAHADALADPVKLQMWPIVDVSYHNDMDEAMDRWVALGYKVEIESALATLAAHGADPAIGRIARHPNES